MRKYALVLLAAVMLAGCSEEKIPEETDPVQTEPVSVTEMTYLPADDPKETDVLPEGTDILPEEFFGEAGQSSAGEANPRLREIPDFYCGQHTLDLSEFARDSSDIFATVRPCGGDNICVSYMNRENRMDNYVCIIDMKEKKLVGRIDNPFESGYAEVLWYADRGVDNAYAEFTEAIRDGDIINDGRKALVRRGEDGQYSAIIGESRYDAGFICGEHIITETDGSLTDEKGNMLLPRYEKEGDEYGFYTIGYHFTRDIDGESFVYSKSSYEGVPGFGIYDLRTGVSADIPDTREKSVIGVRDGKIYSKESYWDGFGTKVYVTDIATLETTLLCDSPYEATDNGINSFVDYFMPQSCGYICAFMNRHSESDGICYRLALLDVDDGEMIMEYSFDDLSEFYFDGVFITDSFICMADMSAGSTLTYVDIPPEGFSVAETMDKYVLLLVRQDGILRASASHSSATPRGALGYYTEPFEDIMGLDGTILRLSDDLIHWSSSEYMAYIDGKLSIIAMAFGNGFDEEYPVDIDGDGVRELICNVVYGADGVRECRVYKMTDSGVKVGFFADLIDVSVADMTMSGNISVDYRPEDNKIIVTYADKETKESRQAEFDLREAFEKTEFYDLHG